METERHIRLLIADDHVMVRQVLRSILQGYSNIEVVGEANDGEEAVVSASKLSPVVVLMDIAMPKMDGITATRLIKEQHPEIAVLGISADPKPYEVHAIEKAGAFDVLKKERVPDDLYRAIQRAVLLPPEVDAV
jgi:DNA-binding NarL/FixJ family response regulator